MQLLIDIGNTRAKYCYVEEGSLSDIHHLALDVMTTNWMGEHWQNITEVVLANVNDKKFTDVVKKWSVVHQIIYQEVVTEAKSFGITNGYKNYQQLGIDRWLTLVAAVKHYPRKNVIIVDAGTATTVDVITDSGHHLGGWILAGIDTMVSSILDNTANLNAEQNKVKKLALGLTTSDNINMAPWVATIGLIEQAIAMFKSEQGTPIDIVITGGNALSLKHLLQRPSHHHPKLVFDGLCRYIDCKSS